MASSALPAYSGSQVLRPPSPPFQQHPRIFKVEHYFVRLVVAGGAAFGRLMNRKAAAAAKASGTHVGFFKHTWQEGAKSCRLPFAAVDRSFCS